ncbi:hypothetical protein CR513_17348, partial [Mucuna pruriens]
MDLDRSFSSPTSPPIYKEKSNPEWYRVSQNRSIIQQYPSSHAQTISQYFHHKERASKGVQTRKDLIEVLLKQYKYNVDMTPKLLTTTENGEEGK